MNKLLLVTVLVALLALSAEGFRLPRQVEEEQGTLTKITSFIKSGYNSTVSTAKDYLERIKGLKIEEKALNLYAETTNIVGMYTGVLQDQMYHIFYSQ